MKPNRKVIVMEPNGSADRMKVVMTKARKGSPSVASNAIANIVPGKFIEFYYGTRNTDYYRSFNVGDECVEDSWNLIYTGVIVKITEKCVTIKRYERLTRLDIATFCDRNYNYDAERISKDNAKTMMYI
jgi:hypothetical protein